MHLRTPIELIALALGVAGCVSAPPSTSASTLAPTTIGAAAAAEYCREYRSTAEIAGAPHEVVGTACRRPDGSWQIVDDATPPGTTAPGTPAAIVNRTTTYVVPYPGYYGPYWPGFGPRFGFGAGFGFGHRHHHHR